MRLETNQTLTEFFRESIEKAQQNQKLPLLEVTQFYLVNLLSEALETKKLLAIHSNPGEEDEPLALTFAKAMQAQSQNEKFRLMKRVGDRSLYVSGFFGDSLHRKVVDIDYYIAMGENAYNFVSGLAKEVHRGRLFPEVFSELAQKFASLVDLIAEISESSCITKDQDLLRLYERWIHTRSERLLERLKEEGILALSDVKREFVH